MPNASERSTRQQAKAPESAGSLELVTVSGRPHLDDRGEPCAVAPLSQGQKTLRAFGIVGALPDDGARAEYGLNQWRENVVWLSGAAVGLVLAIFVLLPFLGARFAVLQSVVFKMLIPSVTAIAFGTAVWWVFIGRMRRSIAPRIASVYLRSGQCASCGYALESLEPEADGCVLCPECNAAWRQERIGAEDPSDAQ